MIKNWDSATCNLQLFWHQQEQNTGSNKLDKLDRAGLQALDDPARYSYSYVQHSW
jgi:hypothetical protein